MLASEMIKELQELIARSGDQEVVQKYHHYEETFASIESIEPWKVMSASGLNIPISDKNGNKKFLREAFVIRTYNRSK